MPFAFGSGEHMNEILGMARFAFGSGFCVYLALSLLGHGIRKALHMLNL